MRLVSHPVADRSTRCLTPGRPRASGAAHDPAVDGAGRRGRRVLRTAAADPADVRDRDGGGHPLVLVPGLGTATRADAERAALALAPLAAAVAALAVVPAAPRLAAALAGLARPAGRTAVVAAVLAAVLAAVAAPTRAGARRRAAARRARGRRRTAGRTGRRPVQPCRPARRRGALRRGGPRTAARDRARPGRPWAGRAPSRVDGHRTRADGRGGAPGGRAAAVRRGATVLRHLVRQPARARRARRPDAGAGPRGARRGRPRGIGAMNTLTAPRPAVPGPARAVTPRQHRR